MGRNKRVCSEKAGRAEQTLSEPPPDKEVSDCLPAKFWKVSSMLCEPGANGKRSHRNMGVAAVFTNIFKNGKKQALWILGLEKYDELEGIG